MNILSKNILAATKISGELLDICDHRDEFTRGDLQGSIEAQIIIAIRHGYDTAKAESVKPYICNRCGHAWHPLSAKTPDVCPSCHSKYWASPYAPKAGRPRNNLNNTEKK